MLTMLLLSVQGLVAVAVVSTVWARLLPTSGTTTTPGVLLVEGAPLQDLIATVPHYGRPPTPHFSGYLDASQHDGCDLATNGPICQLHYMLALAAEEEDEDAAATATATATAAAANESVANKDEPFNAYTATAAAATTAAGVKPTVLWLNGGPGSSSLYGWFQEIGPLLINATGGLMENPYAWTKAGVNVLTIEAPIGVGFSYCSRQLEVDDEGATGVCVNTDTYTAKATKAAMMDFFTTKFPELAAGPFYIAGESYAGVYIPTLAKELLQDPLAHKVVPLKGIMVGDPCTSTYAQQESMNPLWYANKHGLMDSEVYDTLTSDECQDDRKTYETLVMKSMFTMTKKKPNTNRDSNNSDSTDTKTVLLSSKTSQYPAVGQKRSNIVTALELNEELRQIKDLTQRRRMAEQLYHERILGITVATDNDDTIDGGRRGGRTNSNGSLLRTGNTTGSKNINRPHPQVKPIPKCILALRKYVLSSSNGLQQKWHDLYIDDYSLFAPITTKADQQLTDYMNLPEVRKALHVEEAPIDTWERHPTGFQYKKEYYACNWSNPAELKYPNTTMVDIYQEIIPQLERTWIYNGDTDPCLSYEGTRKAVKQIMLDEIDGGSYRPWFYNQTAASIEVLAEKSIKFGPNLVAQALEKAQFGGEVIDYEQGLKFATFHGSGHMVPEFRPQAALHFLNKFAHGNYISNEQGAAAQDYLLTPLLAPNETLVKMGDDEFDMYLDAWTESAMTVPYVLPVNN